MAKPVDVGTLPGSTAATANEYGPRKTCAGVARSKATTGSSASATTWCDAIWRESIEQWHSCHWRSARRRASIGAMHIQILLYDGFDELDAVGPYEILA